MEERLENEVITSTEEINDLLERLKFSEKEFVQVVSTSDDKRTQGFESWAVGKIMAREQPNREAMYRVFKSLWYTKKEVDFVALKEGVIIVKFGCLEDRSRILNLMSWLFDRCLFDRDGGWTEFMRLKVMINILKPLRRVVKLIDNEGMETIGVIKYERLPDFYYTCGLIGHSFRTCESNKEGVAQNGLNHQYRGWLRVPIVNPNQDRRMRRNGVELVKSKDNINADKEESHTNSRDESGLLKQKGMERLCVEESPSISSLDRRSLKTMRDGMG
ncbi:hypothetical protein Gorai_002859, partial [Gossypium raimondii]|nr:hypothetical protein [Gossypium raimondii]